MSQKKKKIRSRLRGKHRVKIAFQEKDAKTRDTNPISLAIQLCFIIKKLMRKIPLVLIEMYR